ncbi:MAG: glycosyltransferase family 2 protein [Dermatophilaceae bacterium]
MSIQLSVVVPMYNEQEVLPLLAARLRPVLDGLDSTYEVVCVDDGSRDLTPALLMRLAREWPEVRVVRLRANAGHQAAISAGLEAAAGDYVVTIDADLQDPPEVIADLLATALDEQVDVVYGVRSDRSTDSRFKRVTARAFYAGIRAMSGTQAPSDAGDFRLMSRATVDAVNQLPQANRVLRLVVPALHFPSATVEYKRDERAAGVSKYPFAKMVRLSLDSVTGFSLFPLRLATYLGLGGAALIVLASIVLLFAARTGSTIPGWTSTVLIVAAVGAVQLVCLGLLGEYVGRMYTQMQGRPAYFIAYDSKAPSRPAVLNPEPAPGSGADLPVALDDPLRRRQLG